MSSQSETAASSGLPRPEPLVRYSRDGDEDGTNAVVSAFREDPIDGVPADADSLYAWVDPDAIDDVLDSAGTDVRLSAVIWDHPVVITSEEIAVYEPGAAIE